MVSTRNSGCRYRKKTGKEKPLEHSSCHFEKMAVLVTKLWGERVKTENVWSKERKGQGGRMLVGQPDSVEGSAVGPSLRKAEAEPEQGLEERGCSFTEVKTNCEQVIQT